jgi:hypothetical protein
LVVAVETMQNSYQTAPDYKAVEYASLKRQILETGVAAVRVPVQRAALLERLLADAYRLRSSNTTAFMDRVRFFGFMVELVARFIWAATIDRTLTDIILLYHRTTPSYSVFRSSRDVIFEFRKSA